MFRRGDPQAVKSQTLVSVAGVGIVAVMMFVVASALPACCAHLQPPGALALAVNYPRHSCVAAGGAAALVQVGHECSPETALPTQAPRAASREACAAAVCACW